MFNILISIDETAWEHPGRFQASVERFKEQSGNEAAWIDANNPATLSALEKVWTFLGYETQVSASDCPVVRFGMLKDIRVEGRVLTFAFVEHGRMSRADFEASAVRLQMGKWALSRTHWSVKDGEIPHDVYAKIAATPKRYDVVLSFAGEDRAYVEAVARDLVSNGVEVFYDKYEEVTLWNASASRAV